MGKFDLLEIRNSVCCSGAAEAYGYHRDAWDDYEVVLVLSKQKPRSGSYFLLGLCRGRDGCPVGVSCDSVMAHWPRSRHLMESIVSIAQWDAGYRYGWLELLE